MRLMTQSIKDTLLKALDVASGDSLERAQRSFKGMTEQQLLQMHGASGRTRQEILDSLRQHRDRIEAARVWVLHHE